MAIKSDGAIPSSSSHASTPAQTTCGNCGVEELRLLHNVRHRGTFRRLCTSCVLRLHSQSFCPSCFAVYSSSPSSGVTCTKCYSSSHAACVGVNHANPYVCPLCVSPNSAIFAPKKVKDLINENPEGANGMKDGTNGEFRVIDKRSAQVLLAAAKISAESMGKAALAARAEAERRAKEAAYTRKRARVALEHVAYLVAKEKLKKKERLGPGARAGAGTGTGMAAGVGNGSLVRNPSSGSGMAAGVGNGSLVRNPGIVKSNGAVGSSNPAVMRLGGAKEESGGGNAVRGDSSSDVLAALNAVELREREKIGGESKPGNVGSVQPSNDVVPMDIEEKGRPQTSANGRAEETVSNGNATAFPRDNNQPVVELNKNVPGN